jgi:pimeloyl-[acyl-carrier protein] methyl ester esterase
VESATKQLPNSDPVSLVAESFSGPIAISLLANKKLQFKASILSATFCKSPRPFLTQISQYVPEGLFASNFASKAFTDLFVTGRGANSDVRHKARDLLNQVSPNQFQSRMGLVNEVDVTDELKEIDVPLLYIQATKDRIVLADSGTEIKKHAKKMEIVKVGGSHMILQTQPETCAELIVNHVTSTSTCSRTWLTPDR